MPFTTDKNNIFMFKISTEDELRLSIKNGLEGLYFKSVSKLNSDDISKIINEKYLLNDHQEMTLLIEATLKGYFVIVDHLLENFSIDIDAVGKIRHFGSVVDGATALWCAAGSGHLEIVEKLIKKGANVDYCTKTKSTPLRAACYLGRLDIVKYLIKHGADVNITNIFDSTCLMIASYKDHYEVVRYLLKNEADVNKQTHCGATAMHFAAQANNINIIKILIKATNAHQLKNKHSLTPILVAAERTHFGLVSSLCDLLPLTTEEKIDAEELLGASYLNDKDTYNKNAGFHFLLRAMELRFLKHPFCYKKPHQKIEAYDNRIECQSLTELQSIENNTNALHYESLVIRERILGKNNPDLLQSIIYRGAVFADSYNFTPCIKLWSHALKIAQYNKLSVHKDILRFTQVFCQMMKRNIKINLSDLKTVLQVAIEELKINQTRLSTVISVDEKEGIEIEYFGIILSTLGLIIITSILLAKDQSSEDPLTGDVIKAIVEINKLKIRTREEQTLLHLCLNYDTNVDNIFTTGICCFPNYLSMKLLIYCGADVNAVDIDQNTPLHYIGKFIVDFPHIPHDSDYLDTKKMVMELINAGAHTDYVNRYGMCPHTGYLKTLFHITNNTPMSLKCLSARALKYTCPKELYHNEIPKMLEDFAELH